METESKQKVLVPLTGFLMHFVHITVFSLCLVLGTSYHLPKTRRFPVKPRELKLSPEAQRAGYKLLPGLRIPNARFCNEMNLQPFQQYMVLPWWYNYCERLLGPKQTTSKDNQQYLSMYGNVLKRLRDHKKARRRQMQKYS